jgi:hypothetical protein
VCSFKKRQSSADDAAGALTVPDRQIPWHRVEVLQPAACTYAVEELLI